jgi:hypothetical protein
VRIAEVKFNTNLSYIALPRQVKEVFLRAEIRNVSPFSLLDGECTVFADGTFISKTVLPLLPVGAATSLELGHDPALVATNMFLLREDKEEGGGIFSDGRRRSTFHYSMTIENRKSVPVEVCVQMATPQLAEGRFVESPEELSKKRGGLRMEIVEPRVDRATFAKNVDIQAVGTNITYSTAGRFLEWRVIVKDGEKQKIPFVFSVETAEGGSVPNWQL